MWDSSGVYRDLAGKPEGKRPLGRPWRRREDNIQMDLKKYDVRAWIGSILLRIGTGGGTCECCNEPRIS
jgi:hypothetical protein